MKNYKEYTVNFVPFNVDLVTGLLWNLEISGITEEDGFISVFSAEEAQDKKSDIELLLNNLKKENLLESFSIDESIRENKNWNEEWEKKVKIIEVGESLVIKPSFRDYKNPEGKIVLTIDPKMSFGTGDHQTTKLVLNLLENAVNEGDKVLDIGSGTAVLGLAAAKYGAGEVIGIDNDEWCFINGNENIEKNGETGRVSVYHTEVSILEEKEFNLVLANINKSVLLEIAEHIPVKMTKTGKLILSGFYQQDLTDITQRYKELGFTLIETLSLDEWCSAQFEFAG